MWYDPVFSAWRFGPVQGYIPQPQPNGDPLEGWGASARCGCRSPRGRFVGTTGAETKGISPVVWGILAGVIVLLVAVFLIRRRRAAEEDV
jgi:LPXTG-motif cell wall-anchored protein